MTMDVQTTPPSDKINWSKLSFNYSDTNCHIKYTYSELTGWDTGSLISSPYLNIHVSSTALNYGQTCFEGMKAFRCKDSKIRLFRPKENSSRLTRSGLRLGMVPPSEQMFLEACYRLVKANMEYVPPFGSGGSLYLRPLLVGSGPQLGLSAAKEFTFIVYAVPVAPYYAATTVKGLKALIPEDFDRAAPMGTGSIKAGGNYAPSLLPTTDAKSQGFDVLLFLDAKTRTFIEEFATSNFLAISPTNDSFTLIAPESPSILPSITTMSLLDLAGSLNGWTVERRPVEWKEVEQKKFTEIAAVGTAVILSPVSEIRKGDVCVQLKTTTGLGEGFKILYDRIDGIQTGELEDEFGWMCPREGVAAWNEGE